MNENHIVRFLRKNKIVRRKLDFTNIKTNIRPPIASQGKIIMLLGFLFGKLNEMIINIRTLHVLCSPFVIVVN